MQRLYRNIVGIWRPESATAKIALQFRFEIPSRFIFMKLDEIVLIPNHLHAIITIYQDSGAIDRDSVMIVFGNNCRAQRELISDSE